MKGMGSVDGVGCSNLTGLLAHPFVSFQIKPSERFAFGRHRGTVIIFCQRSGLLFKLLDACQRVIVVMK